MTENQQPTTTPPGGEVAETGDAARGSSSGSEESASRGAGQKAHAEWAGFKIGDTVRGLGVEIAEILLNTEEVFVFLNTEGGVEWLYLDAPPDSAWAHARVTELESRCAFFQHGMDPKRFTDRSATKWYLYNYRIHERSAKRFIAQGIVILYSGGTKEEAEKAFSSAEQFIIQRGREVSLNWLYSTFGLLAGISAIVLVALVYFFPQNEIFWATLTCASAGGVGAYISRALASRQDIPCDANAGHRLHRAEAILRWSVGVVAGGMICLLVRGKVLLGGLPLDNAGFPVILALAVLAGMSERFLPSLLERFNDKLESSGDK